MSQADHGSAAISAFVKIVRPDPAQLKSQIVIVLDRIEPFR
jgi:hypothetical protein